MMRVPKIKKILLTFVFVTIVLLILTVSIYLQHPVFGQSPSGALQDHIQHTSHYQDDKFQNITKTSTFTNGHTFWGSLRKALFDKNPDRTPGRPLPFVKTDLHHLPIDSTVVIWFGHSSCFIQVGKKRILVDPVFSTNASPVPGSVKAFAGTTAYTPVDIPAIDYILISHDHYDHLDYETMRALKDQTSHVICGLGVGAHLERWGYRPEQILEKDWHEREVLDTGFFIAAEPARHKSGRGLHQNNTLWLSFVIQSPRASLYISGDGGYDRHFAAIGETFGPFDLAIVENGQYDSAWQHIHLLPEETLQVAHDVKASMLLPVHHSRFALARHAWYEPLEHLTRIAATPGHPVVITPMIGQPVYLHARQRFTRWWEAYK
ncbi:MBL fold metallo-hydrolase [Fulvivirgaceae bacterium PWU5]|uniref:MBL fold metallo-hydrolase n=1 Tax=Dawidia cretensis TaxID=2782350 RepID=A0AAP2GVY2_9BACT|nr:MBL fold metallo-hydrolase [Dawidia cretensis]MBT1711568.1 MBL fold metallo-hydrolase [Dawidia cretensis]